MRSVPGAVATGLLSGQPRRQHELRPGRYRSGTDDLGTRRSRSTKHPHEDSWIYKMKIATWNVNSILARLPHVTRWLEAEQPDVLCVQETKCTDDKFPSLEIKALGYDCVMLGQQSYNGVAIISKVGCAGIQRGYPNDDASSQARLLSADIAGVRIINIYVPNGQAVGSEKYQFKLGWMAQL